MTRNEDSKSSEYQHEEPAVMYFSPSHWEQWLEYMRVAVYSGLLGPHMI